MASKMKDIWNIFATGSTFPKLNYLGISYWAKMWQEGIPYV